VRITRFRHRLLGAAIVAVPALVAACASGSGGSSIPSSRTVEERVTLDAPGGGDLTLRLTHDASGSADTVAIASAPAWAALMRAYGTLGLAITASDPGKHLLGAGPFRVHRRLAGQALSQYLDCGSSLTGDNADQYEVTLRVASEIEPAGAQSIVRSQVTATAVAVGSSNSPLRCSSKYNLERRIARLVAGGS
jgi:hypothetical protein